jgi:hypothetical protein
MCGSAGRDHPPDVGAEDGVVEMLVTVTEANSSRHPTRPGSPMYDLADRRSEAGADVDDVRIIDCSRTGLEADIEHGTDGRQAVVVPFGADVRRGDSRRGPVPPKSRAEDASSLRRFSGSS